MKGVLETASSSSFAKPCSTWWKSYARARPAPRHIIKMTWYIVDRDQYLDSLQEIGRVYREIMGKVFPAMAVVQISSLVEPDALLEIESMAVVPE